MFLIRSVWVSGGFSVFVEKRYSIVRIAWRYSGCYASPCPWPMRSKWGFWRIFFPIGCCIHQSDFFSVRGDSSCCASFTSIHYSFNSIDEKGNRPPSITIQKLAHNNNSTKIVPFSPMTRNVQSIIINAMLEYT